MEFPATLLPSIALEAGFYTAVDVASAWSLQHSPARRERGSNKVAS
jgi:hypothetical protein